MTGPHNTGDEEQMHATFDDSGPAAVSSETGASADVSAITPIVPPADELDGIDGLDEISAYVDVVSEEQIDGHTIDELSDYLDRGEMPPDPSIDRSPDCQNALDSLRRLRMVSSSLLDSEARDDGASNESWITAVMATISLDSRPGRDVPIQASSPTDRLSITEGAIRGLIRKAGDAVGGVLIGRCRLEGDVTTLGEPITVSVDASVFWGEQIPVVASRVRAAIYSELLKHTELTIAAIDVTIQDVYLVRDPQKDAIQP